MPLPVTRESILDDMDREIETATERAVKRALDRLAELASPHEQPPLPPDA